MIEIVPSRKILIFVLLLHCFAFATLMGSALSWLTKALLIAVMLIYGCYYFKRYVFLKHACSIVQIKRLSDQFWTITLKNNEVITGTLKSNCLVTQFLIILRFDSPVPLTLTVILTPESIGFQNYRRLMVWLLHS